MCSLFFSPIVSQIRWGIMLFPTKRCWHIEVTFATLRCILAVSKSTIKGFPDLSTSKCLGALLNSP